MQRFIITHSSCAEQYGDMSADTHTHTHTHSHTNKPPTAGIQLVGHTSINIECDIGIRRVQTDKHATGRHLRSHA